MDIISYLAELLQTSKKVGVTGLGTFYKKKSPGRYDADQHAFVPPSFSISFTTNVEETEELIAYISSQRNITTDSASYFVQEFAEKIQGQLSDHQEAHLGQLGKLIIQDQEVTLIPVEESSLDHQFYGLPTQPEISVSETPERLIEIEAENKLEEENPGQETTAVSTYELENDNQPVYEEIAEIDHKNQAHQQAPVIETAEKEEIQHEKLVVKQANEVTFEEEEEEPKKGMGFWTKFLIVMAIILALGAIAYFINPGFFDKYIQQNSEGKPITVQPVVPQADTTRLDSNKTDTAATKQVTSTLNDNTVVDSTKTYYEVIGTSENTKLAADKYIARVEKRGIMAKHLQLSKTRFSVSLGTFTDPKSARKFEDSMRVMLKNKGIYTLPIKPKKHTK